MFNNSKPSSHRQDERNYTRELSKTKPGLSLDTNFSRHIAAPPQQVLSYEASVSAARLREQQDRDASATESSQPWTRLMSRTSQKPVTLQPKQFTRLKPTRLDLDGISPSDRAISIGIVVSNRLPHAQRNHADRNLSASNEDINTPAIVITPAREDFDLSSLPEQRPYRRAPSSVYSRHIDYLPNDGKTPPVPALPFLHPRTIIRPGYDSSRDQKTPCLRQAQASVCTVFEEDTSPMTTTHASRNASIHRATSGALLTPRRSNGWWNLISSPFSAQSSAFSWRSPIDDDRTPILQQRRLSDGSDDELYSAPPVYRDIDSVASDRQEPHRSMTAPSILSTASDGIDIYRIPSQGEAAAYYDPSRHFPDLLVSPAQALSIFDDETPRNVSFVTSDGTFAHAMPVTSTKKSRALFSKPSAEELRTPKPMPRMPSDRQTSTTSTSQLSPLSPSPIIGQAHITQVIGEVNGEQKKIDVPASKAQTPPQGLQFATMASRTITDEPWKHTPTRAVNHSRTSSYGLGITGSKAELYPASKSMSEKQDEPLEDTVRRPPWYRRFLWLLMALLAVLLTLTVVLLVMHVPQTHSDMPVQAQWVNLTGFPPIQTGVSTIAQPKPVREDTGCVNPAALWSCSSATASGSSPNFRFELRFRNDSSLNNTMMQSQHKRGTGSATLARVAMLARDSWADSLYIAKPAPPSTADQIFLGNTTDNITMPFDGEATPFYISVLDATTLNSSSLVKRQTSVYPYPTMDNSTSTNTTASSPQSIPKVIVNTDGTPLDAILYPLVEAQPLRLYKRGQTDEHYGFYTYYDRSVFVANNSHGNMISNTPLSNTSAVCTWSQSRFLVQIWTHAFVSSPSNSTSTAAANSTANDMVFPGSFPYATTITIDRHGGDASQKGVFCYGIGANQHVEQDVKTWIAESRANGGILINPAAVPTGNGQALTTRDAGSGIDGGSGGCACAWQNW